MSYSLKIGDGIFLEKPDRYSISHLWLVITEPFGSPPRVIIVGLTTQRDGSDTTVVLTPADHTFIKHPTIVFYADAREVEANLLERLVALDQSRLHADPGSDALLMRIRDGLLESSFTPRKIKNSFRENCL
jgi:hypothetical protein